MQWRPSYNSSARKNRHLLLPSIQITTTLPTIAQHEQGTNIVETMLSLRSILVAVTAITTTFAAPSSHPDILDSAEVVALETRATPTGQGTSNGFFYSYYNSGGSEVTYNNGAAGSYTTQWTNCKNFVAGKGWNPGSAR